jgi:hypothetical protein
VTSVTEGGWLDRIAEYQRKEEEEKRAWTKANRSAINDIGGTRISPQPYPFIRIIVEHGNLMRLPSRLRIMKASHCHDNVNRLWAARTSRSRLIGIATGYALADDNYGMWRPHSWALSKTKGIVSIIETTVLRAKYFGIAYAP